MSFKAKHLFPSFISSDHHKNKVVKRYDKVFGHLSLAFYHASIVECDSTIEAIVNCTGPRFEAHGGISKALMSACGSQLNEEINSYLERNGSLKHGIVVPTSAYGLSKHHKYILHVSSPTFHRRYSLVNNSLASVLKLTYLRLLRTSFDELALHSLGMPLIGTGLAGIPLDESINDLLDAIKAFADESTPSSLGSGSSHTVFVINNDRQLIDAMIKSADEKLQYMQAAANDTTDKHEEKSQVPKEAEKSFQTDDEDCVICLDKIGRKESKKLDLCGHKFCRECIDDYFKQAKKVCPICNRVYAVLDGDQPDHGTMSHKVINMSLPGYEGARTIEIVYSIPNGVQGSKHPHPGRMYTGCVRTAYLPDTDEGRRVLALLQRAFHHKLIFTVGQSRTTGAEDCVTWNDIHHKTSTSGGPTRFGYPDPNYLSRVVQELASKGIQ